MSELMTLPLVTSIVTAVLIALAVLAFTLRTIAIEKMINALLTRLADMERVRAPKEKEKRHEGSPAKHELEAAFETLRSAIREVPAETERLVVQALAQQRPDSESSVRSTTAVHAYDSHDEPPRGRQDALTQLLAIANRIVQQSSTTLDAFRAHTEAFVGNVSAWPSSTEGVPAAFIVEHRGSYYAVPNVVKPARLPQEWFTRSEFGVNDEIQRVVSLPRLRRQGNAYDVQEAGVFVR